MMGRKKIIKSISLGKTAHRHDHEQDQFTIFFVKKECLYYFPFLVTTPTILQRCHHPQNS